jgi:hypothetical protein
MRGRTHGVITATADGSQRKAKSEDEDGANHAVAIVAVLRISSQRRIAGRPKPGLGQAAKAEQEGVDEDPVLSFRYVSLAVHKWEISGDFQQHP